MTKKTYGKEQTRCNRHNAAMAELRALGRLAVELKDEKHAAEIAAVQAEVESWQVGYVKANGGKYAIEYSNGNGEGNASAPTSREIYAAIVAKNGVKKA